eukprot:scaffold26551_cov115-Isochrysis_galbana.AAC.3
MYPLDFDIPFPLGNPFPMSPGQDRGVVYKAFESLVRKGLSGEEVAREFSPPLVFDASFASRGAEKEGEKVGA